MHRIFHIWLSLLTSFFPIYGAEPCSILEEDRKLQSQYQSLCAFKQALLDQSYDWISDKKQLFPDSLWGNHREYRTDYHGIYYMVIVGSQRPICETLYSRYKNFLTPTAQLTWESLFNTKFLQAGKKY